MEINRIWSMPNKWTFKIPPITDLIKRYVKTGVGWIDPFAGMNSPAEFTNDLNPEMPTIYHLHALEFCEELNGKYNGILFDPPYSLRQMKECYDNIGIEKISQEDTNHFPRNVRNAIASKIKVGGYCLSFGWSSEGIGMKAGFKIIEILLVAHGGKHNDTIVTVEKKIREPGSEILDWRE